MRNHKVKTDPHLFRMTWAGMRNFEIRRDDRGYRLGDTMTLRETVRDDAELAEGESHDFTGRMIKLNIDYVLLGPVYGLMNGWVIMSTTVTELIDV